MKGFTDSGFKTQSRILADFQEDYGLQADEDDDDLETETEDDDDLDPADEGEVEEVSEED